MYRVVHVIGVNATRGAGARVLREYHDSCGL